jgi:hypothetical protein
MDDNDKLLQGGVGTMEYTDVGSIPANGDADNGMEKEKPYLAIKTYSRDCIMKINTVDECTRENFV